MTSKELRGWCLRTGLDTYTPTTGSRPRVRAAVTGAFSAHVAVDEQPAAPGNGLEDAGYGARGHDRVHQRPFAQYHHLAGVQIGGVDGQGQVQLFDAGVAVELAQPLAQPLAVTSQHVVH